MKRLLTRLSIGLLSAASAATVSCAKHDVSLDRTAKSDLLGEDGTVDSEVLLQEVGGSQAFIDSITELFTDGMWKKNAQNLDEFEAVDLTFILNTKFLDGEIGYALSAESIMPGELSNIEMVITNSTYDDLVTSVIEQEFSNVVRNISDIYLNVANLVLSTNNGIAEAISISQESKNNNSIEYLYSKFKNRTIHYKNVNDSFSWVAGSSTTFEGVDLELNLVNSYSIIYADFLMKDNIEWAPTRFSWDNHQENNVNVLYLHFLVNDSIEITVDINLVMLDEGLADAIEYFEGLELNSSLTGSELVEANTKDQNLTLSEIIQFETDLGIIGTPFSVAGGYLDLFESWDVRFINIKFVFSNSQIVKHKIYFYLTDEVDLKSFYVVINPNEGTTNV